jgi:hypothetical protein
VSAMLIPGTNGGPLRGAHHRCLRYLLTVKLRTFSTLDLGAIRQKGRCLATLTPYLTPGPVGPTMCARHVSCMPPEPPVGLLFFSPLNTL